MSVNAQICGLAGGAGLILSAFAPVVSLPIVGAMSPFALHWAAGTVLLLIGLAAELLDWSIEHEWSALQACSGCSRLSVD